MKIKILLLLVIFAQSVVFAAEQNFSKYLKNLETCSPYRESYSTDFKVGNETVPDFEIIAKENILGWQNGKCVITSSAYSIQLEQTLFTSRCEFTPNQLNSLVKKVSKAGYGDEQVMELLKNELSTYINDGYTCKVKTYLSSENED